MPIKISPAKGICMAEGLKQNSFFSHASTSQKAASKNVNAESTPKAQASFAPKATAEKIGIAQSRKKTIPLRREGFSSAIAASCQSEEFKFCWRSDIFSDKRTF
jgi:hypothetical protein